jgi:hypothetical protein
MFPRSGTPIGAVLVRTGRLPQMGTYVFWEARDHSAIGQGQGAMGGRPPPLCGSSCASYRAYTYAYIILCSVVVAVCMAVQRGNVVVGEEIIDAPCFEVREGKIRSAPPLLCASANATNCRRFKRMVAMHLTDMPRPHVELHFFSTPFFALGL